MKRATVLSIMLYIYVNYGGELVKAHLPYQMHKAYNKTLKWMNQLSFEHVNMSIESTSRSILVALVIIGIIKLISVKKRERIEKIRKKLKAQGIINDEPVAIKVKRNQVKIENILDKTEKEVRAKLGNLKHLFNKEFNKVEIIGTKIILTVLMFIPPVRIEPAGASEIYWGNSIDKKIISPEFSAIVVGQAGTGKTEMLKNIINSHLMNNKSAKIVIFDYKCEDFAEFEKHEQITFMPMRTEEELKAASEFLEEEIKLKNESKVTMYLMDEVQQYLNPKNTPNKEKQKIMQELVISVDTMLATFRSTGKKIILSTQRAQQETLAISLSNLQIKLLGIIDIAMEDKLRPQLKKEKFGKGVWSFQSQAIAEPIVIKSYYGGRNG